MQWFKARKQGHWAAVVVLNGLAVCTVACPLADPYIARRSEYAADGSAPRWFPGRASFAVRRLCWAFILRSSDALAEQRY